MLAASLAIADAITPTIHQIVPDALDPNVHKLSYLSRIPSKQLNKKFQKHMNKKGILFQIWKTLL